MMDQVVIAMLFGLMIAAALLGWYIETRFRIALTSFLLFTIFFFLSVIPGFVRGMVEQSLSLLWATTILFTAFGSFFVGAMFVVWPISGGACLTDTRPSRADLARKTPLRPLILLGMFLVLAGLALYGGIPPAVDNVWKSATVGLEEDDLDSLSEARRTLTKEHVFGGVYRGQGMLREILFVGFLFLVGLAWQRARVKRRFWSWFLFFVIFAMSFVFVGGDGTRGPFLHMVIAILVAESLLKPVSGRMIAVSAVAVVALGVFVSAYSPKMHKRLDEEGGGAAVMAILERITMTNSMSDAFAVRLVDEGRFDLGYGYWTLRDLIAAMPGAAGGPPLAYELYIRSDKPQGNTTYMTGTLVSRGYVDGGLLGVALCHFLVGLMCGATDLLLLRKRASVAYLAFLAALFILVARSYMTGPVGILTSVTLLLLIALPVVIGRTLRERLWTMFVPPAHARRPRMAG